jgi:hypothetical protein
LTLLVEPQAGEELRAWAAEEDRPIANLLRRIVSKSLAEHRQRQGAAA